ncbi:MAG TPA: cytochrome c3 family protein [Kofleriaceae bacterium]
MLLLGGVARAAPGFTVARGELSVRGAFSHERHAARGARCAMCHTAAPDPVTHVATAPAMASCAAGRCHDGAAAFAVTAACTRCHGEPASAADFKVERPVARYSHRQHAQVGLACAACHPLTAAGEVVTVGHAPCATCHAADFARRKPTICGACHNGSEPWRALVADRGPPERTEFGAALDHALHRWACTGCHALTTPASQLRPPRGHRACTGAACHAIDAGPAPLLARCEQCHQPGLASARAAARLAAPWSVRATFDHAGHARTGAIACETCHVARTGADLLAMPTPPKSTCAPCHDGAAAFKLTGTGCTRCHPGGGT